MDKQKFIEAFHEKDALSRMLGMRLVRLEEGCAEAEMEITSDHLNFMGTLHGGTLFTIADVVAGTAVSSWGQNCVTLNSTINYIRAVNEGKIIAKASVIHKGRTTGVCEVKIFDSTARLLCAASFTMFMTGKEILL